MPIVNLYNKDLKCDIGFFGTPLCANNIFVGAPNTISPFINVGGTVISTNPDTQGSVFNSWSSVTGGWSNWNPSPSIIPSDSIVEYAFLVWSSAYYPPITPPFEVTANTTPILLTKPDGTTIPVTPNPAYNINFNAGWWQFTHGAEITNIMKDNQYGNYIVTAVPTGNYSTSTGVGAWGIYILYSNQIFPYRNANLNVSATGFNTTVTISNLFLPVTGPVTAKIFLESVQGDRGAPYFDSLLLNGVTLSGPFNPANDFMNDRFVDYTGTALQSKGSLIVETGSTYAFYADQTIIINNTILKNSDTQAVLTQRNSSDWAGVSFLGTLIDLNSANLIPIHKDTNMNFVAPNETLTYTIVFTNSGSVPAQDINLLDTLPSWMTFVPNSLLVNSTPYAGDVTMGVSLPDLAVNATYTIVFNALVSSTATINSFHNNVTQVAYSFIPAVGDFVSTTAYSNVVTTTVVNAILNASKSVDKTLAKLGDTLTYTIVLTNTCNRSATTILFTDTIPSNVTLIPSSLKQDNTSFTYNSSGSLLPNSIGSNSTSTITYTVTINSVSPNNPIPNDSSFIYSFIVDSTTTPTTTITYPANSNSVSTLIKFVNLSSIAKYVDKAFADCGDTLTYTLVLPNNGNTTALNVILNDTIPNGTVFINNSVTVNGVTQSGSNPQTGINLGNIFPGTTTTVTFQAKVQC